MGKIKDFSKVKFSTKTIHAGGYPDKETGALMPPIYQTSTYAQSTPGKHQGYEYSRSHNPTRTRVEEAFAALEGAKYALATASGLSCNMLLMHLLEKNSLVFCGDDVYGGTYRIFTTVFNDLHNFHFLDTTDTKNTIKMLQAHRPAMIWLESPTNPMLKISDIKKICSEAKKLGIITVVDNTFMSPYFQNPLELGADIVVHSVSKYINGHSDVIGGAIMLNNKKYYEKLWTLQNSIGPTQSPFDSWLVLRGIKTLAIRMQTHEKNAIKVAKFLESHKKVSNLLYPGLKSHPQHALAKRQMNGFGGMITLHLKGGLKESKKFLSSVKIFALAESLGGVESLIEHPAIMTHASVPKDIREELGITDNLIRISVGIEDADDLIADLEEALKKV